MNGRMARFGSQSAPWMLAAGAVTLAAKHFAWLDGDTYWHLAVGRDIVAQGALPTFNTLAHTGGDTAVLHQQWLPFLGLYAFAEWFGESGLVWLTAAAWAGVFFLTGRMRVIHDPGENTDSFTPLTAVVFVAMVIGIGLYAEPRIAAARSEVLGLLCFVVLWTIMNHAPFSKWSRLGLAVAMCVWANSHSSFPMGFVVAGCVLFGSLIDTRRKRGEESGISPRTALVFLAILSGVSLFNPYGWRIYPDAIARVTSPHLAHIDVFRSPDLSAHESWIQLGYLACVGALFVRNRTRLPSRVFILAAVLTALYLASARFFVFVFVATVGPALALTSPYLSRVVDVSAKKTSVACAAVLVLACGGAGWMAYHPHPQTRWADFLRRIPAVVRLHQPPQNLFNYYTWGGYLMWTLPSYPVFIDGRNNVYADNGVFEDYVRIASAQEGWEELLQRYAVNTIIYPAFEPRLTRALDESPAWTMRYSDGPVRVWVRRLPSQPGM